MAQDLMSTPTVVMESNGLVDPTPRGHCVEIAQRNQEQSGFLQLSAELRNIIYGYVFDDIRVSLTPEPYFDYKVYREGVELSIHPDGQMISGPLCLLHVCRFIYAEARLLPFVYGCFKLLYNYRLDSVMQHIRDTATTPKKGEAKLLPAQIDAITTIELSGSQPGLAVLLQDFACLPSLKQIHWHFYPRNTPGPYEYLAEFQEGVGHSVQVYVRNPHSTGPRSIPAQCLPE